MLTSLAALAWFEESGILRKSLSWEGGRLGSDVNSSEVDPSELDNWWNNVDSLTDGCSQSDFTKQLDIFT